MSHLGSHVVSASKAGAAPGSRLKADRPPVAESRRRSAAGFHGLIERYLPLGGVALMVGDGLTAVVLFLVLVTLRIDAPGGAWSVPGVSPIELAVPYGVLWVGALWLVGLYREPAGRAVSTETVDVLRATVVLLLISFVALLAFDLTNVSRLLIAMLVVAQPTVSVGSRFALRAAQNASIVTRSRLSGGRSRSIRGRLLRRRLPIPGSRMPAMPVTVIEPPKRWPGFGLGEFWRLRRICFVLTRRNLMVRYRQTVIGAAWSLLQPILLMIVFTVFFGFLGRGLTEGLPFPVFYLLGLVPYQMVSKILSEGSASVVSNSALVTRVYFPRAYFPTSIALASMTDFLLALIPVAILLLVFGALPGPDIVFAPLFVAIAWIAGLGAAYWLSALNVAYRDITQLMPFLTQLLMFLSPIIYTSTLVPEPYRTLYFLNPLAMVVEGLRWSLANGPELPPYAWILGPTVAVFLLLTGYVFFRKRELLFADYV